MISRSLKQAEAVHAFDLTQFHSCTVAGFTCTCAGPLAENFFGGRIIDRFGLLRNYSSVAPLVTAYADITTSAASTAMLEYYGVRIGLQHSATTCSADFASYSTVDWAAERALAVVTTATSTGATFYSVSGAQVSDKASGLLSTALTSSTSTGYGALVGGPITSIPITGASRYLRLIVAPHIEATGCGSPQLNVMGTLLFGDGDEAPAATGIRGRVHVTSACSS